MSWISVRRRWKQQPSKTLELGEAQLSGPSIYNALELVGAVMAAKQPAELGRSILGGVLILGALAAIEGLW